MEWKDLATTVGKVAPVLGTVLGGPAGAVAGAAGSLIAGLFGDDVEPTPDAVDRALKADPNAMLKLKELEARERDRLLNWQEKQLDAYLANVSGARAREVALAKAGHGGAWVTAIVALVVIVGFFWMLNIVVEAETVNEPALLLLGSLGTAFGAVVNYYLGSSLGSFRKDAQAGGVNALGRKSVM